jgi:pimeloyl-ACP methyl ester carboxylesterase
MHLLLLVLFLGSPGTTINCKNSYGVFNRFRISAFTEDVKDYDFSELLSLFKTMADYRPEDVQLQDVTFYLYTRSVSNLPLALEDEGGIDITKRSTKFVIHGYIDNHNRSWYHNLTEEYLKKGDFNLIHVDWRRVSHSFYLSSAQNTKIVGKIVGTFIVNHKIPPKKVHLIGHSLGAHVSAFAAQTVKKMTGVKVGRITGLDPAGPGFRNILLTNEDKLDANDADIVDVIHTDGGVLGLYKPLGTFDIYINGGTRIQPDCNVDLRNITIAELFEDSEYYKASIDNVKNRCLQRTAVIQEATSTS